MFEDDQMHGEKGKMEWSNGNWYFGDFQNGEMHGRGTMYYRNGKKYIGPFVNGMRHGNGIETAADGSKRQGEWKDDKRIQWISKPIKQNGENNKVLSN